MNNQESLADLIVATLGSARNTKKFKSILFKRRLKKQQSNSAYVALSRLKSGGYIMKTTSGWSVTKKGENMFRSKYLLSYITSPFKINSPASTIIAFDIPEKNRKVRNWLRNQIKIFGYEMLQKSLWIGPGPLPKEFLERLEKLEIRKNVKTFRIKR